MKRVLKILSFICLASIATCALHTLPRLPADPRPYVEKKYAGWNGVLRGWVCSDWSCAGSFVSWLNSAAAEFEKQHDGVYLEFETVSAETIAALDSLYPPEMLFFSSGISAIAAEPVAMGGYIFIENPDAAGAAIPPEYAAPLIAMYEPYTPELPDSGIDLGLPAMQQNEAFQIDPDSFRRFRNGELGRTIVSQSQLAELIRLRDNGRGPDWRCLPQGRYSWCDQLLLMGLLTDDAAPRSLCEAFLAHLLSDDCQMQLASIGAFPVTGASAYSDFSAYRPMETQLRMTQPIFPKPEHSSAELAPLVRKLSSGEISPDNAVQFLLQTSG